MTLVDSTRNHPDLASCGPVAHRSDGAFVFLSTEIHHHPSRQQEQTMAKGQKRSNREIKKPKQVKKQAEATPSTSLTKGMVSVTGGSKKK